MLRLPTFRWVAGCTLLAALVGVWSLQAQEGPRVRVNQDPQPGPALQPAPAAQPAPPKQPPPRTDSEPRDPTTVRPDLRPVLDPPANQPGATVAPVVALRGRIVLASGEASGILDVNGQMFMVRQGSQIDTFIGAGTPVTVKVKTFSAAGVAVEIEQLGKTFHLR